MNATDQSSPSRSLRSWAAVVGSLAGVALGAMFGTAAYADMYMAPTNAEGGVQAASTITSITPAGTNTTVCWYGMQGWYTIEATTNVTTGPWIPAGRVAASDFSWCATVANPDPTNSYSFRLNQANAYAGSGACAGCHGAKFSQWTGTVHSHALADLHAVGLPPVVENTCRVCHTVGKGQPTGFTDTTNTPYLTDVGCENCHGPAAWHKYSDHDLIRPAVSLDPKICGGCHTDSHHPTYDEYATTLHAEVNDDVKYGGNSGVYYPDTITFQGLPAYGYYVTPKSGGGYTTNLASGIVHSRNGPGTGYGYDPGQDRAIGCGICHSAAARMAMLNDYQSRLDGHTNVLSMPAGHDAGEWTAACATCHDPHSLENTAQLRNPTRSTNYFTMATTADKTTYYTTDSSGMRITNATFMSAAFANMYDPSIQVCGQCHNTRGARWDGRSFGYYLPAMGNLSVTTNGPGAVWGVQTNISLSRPPHHSPQYNVLVGIVQPDYFTTNSSGVATNFIARHGVGVSSSSGNYNTNQCATCHVPNYAVNANTNVTGHTFELDTKNCTLSGCHGSVPRYEETMATTTNNMIRVVSLLNQWALAKGTNTFGAANATKYGVNGWEYTTPGGLASSTVAGPSAADQNKIPDAVKQARFNLYMVLHDGSSGVHNPNLIPALVTDAETKVSSQFPLANFKASVTAGFTPLTVTFTGLGTGVTGYSWKLATGVTSGQPSPTFTYSDPGTYTVTLTATGASGTEKMVRTNYITVADKPVVTFTASPTSGQSPLTVNFTNTSSNTNSVTLWRWSINGKSIYSQDTVYTFTNVYTTNVSYNISLRGYTPGGNVTTTSNSFITVTP